MRKVNFVIVLIIIVCSQLSTIYSYPGLEKSKTVNITTSQVDSSDKTNNKDKTDNKEHISILWSIPFVLILFSIAIIPLIFPHFWHLNYWKITLFIFCIPMMIANLFFINDSVMESTFHEVQSYISFIMLLASLFTISGAILIRGNILGKPIVNTIILLIGTLLSSFMATTGASMLLIRHLIKINKFRHSKVHIIIFFIFTVSNTGGLLTPLGDPPLFLGYLRGVPFTWTLNLIPQWLIVNAILLLIFFIWDNIIYKREVKKGLIEIPPDYQSKREPFSLEGKVQFFLLIGVVLSIYFQGHLSRLYNWWPHFGPQEGLMLIMMILSLVITKPNSKIRKGNDFSWYPIKEVAVLFAGIFACMVPTLYLLKIYGPELGVVKEWQFFWITGGLSSLLDNAPTYLVFMEIDKSLLCSMNICSGLSSYEIVNKFIIPQFSYLAAISCGAVFMGANSYIGNAPNFMVKSIAEERGIKMPSFFGYMIYSLLILVPIFLLITFIFFLLISFIVVIRCYQSSRLL